MFGRGRARGSPVTLVGKRSRGQPRFQNEDRGPPMAGGRMASKERDSNAPKFLDVADIVKILCATPQHAIPAEAITSKLGCSKHTLKCVTERFKHILDTSSAGNSTIIELKPQVKFCQDYIKSSGCTSSTHCKKLHICHEYTYGSCREFDCEYGHRWNTTHNHSVWAYFFLGDVGELVLQSIMKKHSKRVAGVAVCKPYNEQCCPSIFECKSLHICQKLIDGSRVCDTKICTLNHDILSRQCATVLSNAGISIQNSRRDVLLSVRKAVTQVGASNVRHEKAKVELLDCFQDLREQEDKARDVVLCLLTYPNFYCSFEDLSKKIGVDVDVLQKLVNHYYFLFIIYMQSNGESLLKLQPRLALCHFYSATQKCRNGASCSYLHLCINFLKGVCQDGDGCNAIHSLTEHPNDFLLKKNFLDEVPLGLVLPYFKVRFCTSSAPFVCFLYNQGKCTTDDCKDLHVCYDYLFTQSTCSSSCLRDHNLHSDENLPLLVKDKLDGLPYDELFAVLSARISHWPKRANAVGTASQLNGDVECEEICEAHLSSECGLKAKCRKMHAPNGFHWQFCKDGVWFNFNKAHSDNIEVSFRDASKDSVHLKPHIYGNSTKEKEELSCLNQEGLSIDFEKMCLVPKSNRFKYMVRRLSTPSSAQSRGHYATVYGWYFKDKNGAWIEYGNRDSSTSQRHKTNESSTDIELAYLKDPQGKVNLNASRFNYTLSFAHMEQTNDTTGVVRDIRRRPKHLVIEKFLDIDPYNVRSEVSKRTSESGSDHASRATSRTDAQMNDFPNHWEKMVGNGPEIFTVSLGSDEGVSLTALVLNTIPSAEITKISRLQNTYHYSALKNQVELIKAREKKQNIILQKLFHGTREVHLKNISQNNLEWRQGFADSGRKFGRGAYFFNNAQIAHQFASSLQGEDTSSPVVLVVADVYVGSVALGTPDMIRPPPLDNGRLYDTTVNSLTVPSVFVKYNSKEYCPLYFVHLKL